MTLNTSKHSYKQMKRKSVKAINKDIKKLVHNNKK